MAWAIDGGDAGSGTGVEGKRHGEKPVEIVINDQIFYQAVDLMIPARPDSGVDMHQGPSRPDDEVKDQHANKENRGEDDPMEAKADKVSEIDLRGLERDHLKYGFNEAEDGWADETLLPMTPS